MKLGRFAAVLGIVLCLAPPAAFGQRAGGWSRAALGEALVSGVHASVSTDGRPVVFATSDGGVFRRENRGQWEPVSLPAECSIRVVDFVPAPTDERIRYVQCGTLYSPYRYLASEDSGTSWRALDPAPNGILVDAGSPYRLYSYSVFDCQSHSTTCPVRIDFSVDAGRSWQLLGYARDDSPKDVASSPGNPDLVIVFMRSGNRGGPGLFLSADGGATWLIPFEWTGAGFLSGAIDPRDPSIVIASVFDSPREGTVTSTDSGMTWVRVNDSQYSDATFANDDTASSDLALYALSDGVRRSRDRGRTWGPFSEGLPSIFLFHLTASTDRSELFVIGDDRHLYERNIAPSTVEETGLPLPAPVSGR